MSENPLRPLSDDEIDGFVQWASSQLADIPTLDGKPLIQEVLAYTHPIPNLDLIRLANTLTVLRETVGDLQEGFRAIELEDEE